MLHQYRSPSRLGIIVWLLGLLMPATVLRSGPPIPPQPDPRHPVDYIDWMQRMYQPPSKLDATQFYAEAERLFPDYGDTDERLAPFIRGPWRECDLEVESRLIKYEWAVKAYNEATDRPRYFLPLVEFGDFADFKIGISFGATTFPAHTSIALAWREFAAGNEAPTIEAARRCLIAADHLAQQPLIMGEFIGATQSDLACSTLLRALRYSTDVRQLLMDHGESVLGWVRPSIDARRGFAGEQIGAFDALQRSFNWNAESQLYTLEPRAARRAVILNGWKRPKVYEVVKDKLETFDFVSTRDTVVQYFELVQNVLAETYVRSLDRSGELDAFATRAASNPFVPLFLFKSSMVVEGRHRQATGNARWHGMRLVWGLMMHRQRTGALPQSLDNLPAPLRGSIDFAKTQGLRWAYHLNGKTFTLNVAGFKRDAHEASRAFTDEITIWPLLQD